MNDGIQDEAAFQLMESVVREHQAKLRAFLFSRVRDREATEDLAQETFLVFMHRIKDFDPSRSAWPWLMGIARNKLQEHWRHQRKETLTDSIEDFVIRWQLEEGAIGRTDDDEHERSLEALHHCLESMKGESRDLLRMTYADQMHSEDVAGRLKRNASSVRVVLCRLRDRLAKCMHARLEGLTP